MAKTDLASRKARIQNQIEDKRREAAQAEADLRRELAELAAEERRINKANDDKRARLIGALIVRTREEQPARYDALVAELASTLKKPHERELFGLEPLPGEADDAAAKKAA